MLSVTVRLGKWTKALGTKIVVEARPAFVDGTLDAFLAAIAVGNLVKFGSQRAFGIVRYQVRSGRSSSRKQENAIMWYRDTVPLGLFVIVQRRQQAAFGGMIDVYSCRLFRLLAIGKEHLTQSSGYVVAVA